MIRFGEKEGYMYKYTWPFRTIALFLCFLLSGGGACIASAQTSAPPKSLQIVILEGEGALNNIKQRTAHEPIVQVQDENHKPIAGAAVIFLLPNSGPGGSFLNSAQSFSTVTDAEGKAIAHGLMPNKITGHYQIQVRAKYNDLSTETTIAQENVLERTASPSHAGHPVLKWVIIGAAAAGVGVAIGFAAQGSHSTTIAAGPPTVGAP
jgi:hypothetical protein